MALIEGVGDEVTLLFGVVLLMLVLVLAWSSTHTVEPPEHLVTPGPVSTHPTEPESPEPRPVGDPASPPLLRPREDGKAGAGREAEADGSVSGGAGGDGGVLDADGLRHRNVPGPSLDSESAPGATQASSSEDVERNMVLRLKFLNDTERVAHVHPDDTIGYLKRTYFSGQEHQVRLIYQGQLLQDDAQNLTSLNLTDNSVLHCHISQHATRAAPAGARATDQVHMALNVGSLMVPLFVLMLSVLWYFQFQYRQFFTAPATASLVGITIFFSFVAFGLYRR